MGKVIFVTGGARSGKSSHAENLAKGFGAPLGYLATAQAFDGEMTDRIKLHQERRGPEWSTIEEPLHLPQALASHDGQCAVILVDCLTLWLSNLLFRYEELEENIQERILEDLQRLKTTLHDMTTPVILVSNEVGMGIVPEHPLGRMFRDLAGLANQRMAALADEAWLVVSGIPMRLK